MTALPMPSARLPSPRQRDDALPRGTRLEGCVVESVLAESGFSIVYRARAPDGVRLVAIKEYLPMGLVARGGDGFSLALRASSHAEAFTAGLAAFEHEAEMLARCQHPALLPVLGVWRDHGTVYRAMPLLEGTTLLAQRATLAAPPDQAAVLRLLDALCGALQVLHGAGQAHGAVAPGKVFLRADDGRPVLMDTGAVRRAVLGDDTRALMAMLEPAHSCASTAESASDPLHADLCGLATLAAFWITGRMPGPAVAGQPPPLTAAVQAMQARDPALHYGAALVAAVDAVLTGSGVAAARSLDEFRRALVGRAVPLPVQAMRNIGSGETPPAPAAAVIAPKASPVVVAAAAAAAARAAAPALAATPAAQAPTVAPAGAARERAPALATVSATAAPASAAPAMATPPAEVDAAPPRGAGGARIEPVLVETRRGYPRRKNSHRGRWLAVAVVAFVLAAGTWVFQQQRAAFQDRAARAAAVERESAAAAAAAREMASAPSAAGPGDTTAGPPNATPVGGSRNAAGAGRPAKPADAKVATAPPATPRAACGDRTPFSLYRCMQAECRKPQWAQHSQCIKMNRSGIVD